MAGLVHSQQRCQNQSCLLSSRHRDTQHQNPMGGLSCRISVMAPVPGAVAETYTCCSQVLSPFSLKRKPFKKPPRALNTLSAAMGFPCPFSEGSSLCMDQNDFDRCFHSLFLKMVFIHRHIVVPTGAQAKDLPDLPSS